MIGEIVSQLEKDGSLAKLGTDEAMRFYQKYSTFYLLKTEFKRAADPEQTKKQFFQNLRTYLKNKLKTYDPKKALVDHPLADTPIAKELDKSMNGIIDRMNEMLVTAYEKDFDEITGWYGDKAAT